MKSAARILILIATLLPSLALSPTGTTAKPDSIRLDNPVASKTLGASREQEADIRAGIKLPPGHSFVATASLNIYGADAAAARVIRDTMALMVSHGFVFPEVNVHAHDRLEACDGHNGIFARGGDLHRVDICLMEPFIIRHELAHVWERHNLDDAAREAFLERTGLAVWNDPSVPHHLRGIERAAQLIAWGTISRPIQPAHCYGCEDELALYESLTGRPSPRIASANETAITDVTRRPKAAARSNRRIAVVG